MVCIVTRRGLHVSLALFVGAGCGSYDLNVNSFAEGCEEFDFEDPNEENLELQSTEGAIPAYSVVHTGVEDACDAEFSPEIAIDGKEISVREFWTAGDVEVCSICWSVGIEIKDPPEGEFVVVWYLEDSEESYGQVTFEVD